VNLILLNIARWGLIVNLYFLDGLSHT